MFNDLLKFTEKIESNIKRLSSDENEALKRAGCNHKLRYNNSDKYNSNNNNINSNNSNNNGDNDDDNNNDLRTSKQRKRNIIWFNPPFSKNVATKIGRYFLNLVDKHFPRDHKFHKIFNRNNIEVSYSVMPSIKTAINSHNREILHPSVNSQSKTCTCIKKRDFPLQEKCLSENTLYQADVN